MNKFAITDTVRVIAPRTRYFDEVGRVIDEAAGMVQVIFPQGGQGWFYPDELVLAEAPVVGA